jgi:hypothetical protein
MTKWRPPKDIVKRRQESQLPRYTQPSKQPVDWKFWSGMIVGVIGSLATILALWLTVEDRPTVSLGPPRDPHNVLSTEVIMVDNGVLPIHDVSFAVFLKHGKIANILSINEVTDDGFEPSAKVLMPGEPVTSDLSIMAGPNSHLIYSNDRDKNGNVDVQELDIALIAKFRPTWAPFWKRTRAFRFRTVTVGKNTVLEQIPTADIETEYEKALKGH